MRLTSDVGFSVGELEGVRVGFFDGWVLEKVRWMLDKFLTVDYTKKFKDNMVHTESDGLLLGTGVIGDNVGPLEGVKVGWFVGCVAKDRQ